MNPHWSNIMLRRGFLASGGAGLAFEAQHVRGVADNCGCTMAPLAAVADACRGLHSHHRHEGVWRIAHSPIGPAYVFVKLETDPGVVGWGKALEGKGAAVMACLNDFHDFLIGDDPMQVEHIWQSMYIHSFYRADPVIASAISGIDQALWDIRGKVLGMPVYQLLGGPVDARGVRGYYHSRANIREDLLKHRETALQQGVSCFKYDIPGVYEYIETHAKIERAVESMRTLRENLGPDINIAVAFHAKTSPSVASVIVKELWNR
jgi:galactonate dehydratase